MARRLKTQVDAEQQCMSFVGNRKPKKERKKASTARATSTKAIERHIEEQRAFRETNDWSDATPKHFVALYIDLHEWCYGVRPAELKGAIFSRAMVFVSKMIAEEFNGRIDGMLDYMRWAWRREKKTETWRRENKHEGGILTWQELFVYKRLMTRYRIQLARKIDV